MDIEYVLSLSVGYLVEKNPVEIPKILTRLGLPCVSCIRLNSETLLQAMDIHNVDIDSNKILLKEITAFL